MNDKGYNKFHGRNPAKRIKADIHDPKHLILLGRAIAIEYECDKVHGGGDGRKAVYRHVFDKDDILCMDERNKEQLYILGPRLKVTKAGIEN